MQRSVLLLALCLLAALGAGGASATRPAGLGRPPGTLVDAGGHRLHVEITGAGSPAVVLEIGASAFSFDWSLVRPRLAGLSRVCVYDRAGFAWSDPGPKPRTLRQIAFELHTVLRNARVSPPYVLVGHSLGGLVVRVYTREYPDEVAGIVLVDSTHEDTQLFMNNKLVRFRELSQGRPIPAVQTKAAPVAVPGSDSQPLAKVDPPFDKLPVHVQKLRLAAQAQAKFADASGSEFDFLADEMAQLFAERRERPHSLGDRPLVVLAAGADRGGPPPGITPEQWRQFLDESSRRHQDLATLSTNSKLIVAAKSRHEVHLDEPELVVHAIRDVVRAVRTGSKL